jgi:hypothetical protein
MSTGFTPDQNAAILLRDGGICAMIGSHDGCAGRADTANHRLNRGAGGSKLRNGMSNGCAICHVCNGLIESDSALASVARERGVKLRQGDEPAECRLWSPFFHQWVKLSDYALTLTGETDPTAQPEQA